VNDIWTNSTSNTYNNSTVPPHGWSNITVYAYNLSGSGSLSTPVFENIQLNNNAPPSIIFWSNNKTNNNNLLLTIKTNENVNFNATADQMITKWNWTKDGYNQSNNYNNLSVSWNTSGIKNLNVNATNSNGTSNTISWTVLVINQITISSCSTLNQANSIYVLTTNISSSGTCFTIGANNITLEGQYYTVEYKNTGTGTGYGIVDSGGYNNIIIRNLSLSQKNNGATNSHGIYFKNVATSRVENVLITTQGSNSDGIYLDSSSSNTFSNFNITTSGNVGYGVYTKFSNSNNFTGFNITTLGSNSNGLYITTSNSNNYSNLNISTSGPIAHGIYLDGDYNILSNLNVVSSGQGFYIRSANSNIIKDGSIISKSSNDYYLQNLGITNSFMNTNFSIRKIYLYDNASSFNYNNETNNGIWLNTTQIVSPSAGLTINRALINWNQSNLSWQETTSSSRGLNYSISGLLPITNYSIWNGSINKDNFTTDNDGNLPVFRINFTTSSKTIKVLLSSIPPNIILWSNNKTINDNLTLTINTSEFVKFNATANQTVTSWNWFKDGVNQNYNNDNFTTSWNNAGLRTIQLYSHNSNGTSNTITWAVNVMGNHYPIQAQIGNKNIGEGRLLTFIVNSTDEDNDSIIYGTNASKGTLDPLTGVFSWQTVTGDRGIYSWYFNSSDGKGGVASETITINVLDQGYGQWIDLNDKGNLTVKDSSSINNLSSATWSIWVNQKQYTDNAGLFGKYQPINGKKSYLIRTSYSNEISLELSKDGINTVSYSSGMGCGIPNNNVWNMITVTFNGSLIKYYLNGGMPSFRPCDTDIATVNSLFDVPVNLTIGEGNNVFFNGSVDDIYMNNRSLSDTQVYRLYQESEHGLDGRKTIPVLMYHTIQNNILDSYTVSINNFTAQMKYLHDNNYTTITLENFNQWQKGNFTMPKKPVILTFDDGYISVYENATPILDQYNYIGVAGVVTNSIDKVSSKPPEWGGYMTWSQLRNLQNKGWEIVSHSISHSCDLSGDPCSGSLKTLNETLYRAELNDSNADIKKNLGRNATSFIFPYNSANASYMAICGEYYDICIAGVSSDVSPLYTTFTDDGHSYVSSPTSSGIKRIGIYYTTRIDTFANIFGKDTNVIGELSLNEGAGNITYDSSGKNNNAILNANVSWSII
jgi:peptidoglycan/xylan/chitin deacetylase (PgdA/CDA1 family)